MKRSFVLFSLLSILAASSFSETVKDLSKVSKATKDESHRRYFDREMSGIEHRNTKIKCEVLNKLFGYTQKASDSVELSCDARDWRYNGEPAVAVVLVRNFGPESTLDIGVVDCLSSPKLLLKLNESQTHSYQFSLDRFDPTLFDLGVLGKAVGVRVHRGGCGAGGSICADGMLQLFAVDNRKLRMVFDSQMDYYGSYGGAWNEDGTREHEVEEEQSVLVIGKGNPPALMKKSVGAAKAQTQTFNFNASTRTYTTNDPDFLNSVDR